jgi:hypothetical protein
VPNTIQFSYHDMFEITKVISEDLTHHNSFSFEVLNPDYCSSTYAGTEVSIENKLFIYRSYKAWNALAEQLFCRICTPKIINNHLIMITFEKLQKQHSFHHDKVSDKKEKYGVQSEFFNINKLEEPNFLLAYKKALQSVKIENREHILNLGVNRADEFIMIEKMCETVKKNFVGIDFSQSAINTAQKTFYHDNYNFICDDINSIHNLELNPFDLIISIGTLQSPSINFKPFFMSLVQNLLTNNGAIILGFPNCRWIAGEMIYGAQPPNYNYSEMTQLYNDVDFCKRYLQQKKFRVTITGREYIFLTATKIGIKD